MRFFTALLATALHLLFLSICLSAGSFNPSNTIIISDINEVLVDSSELILNVGRQLKKIADYFVKNSETSAKESSRDDRPNGTTFNLLYQAMRRPYIIPYIPWILNHRKKVHHFITGTEKIYHYLKYTKGYTFVFATNQDHLSYNMMPLILGKLFTCLPDKVFVAQPGNSPEIIAMLQTFANAPTTPANYKQLLEQALTIKPTEIVLHAPRKKPEAAYFQYVEEHLDKNKNMIFIDDMINNVIAFEKALQNNAPAKRIGLHFKDPKQLAEEFIKLGILSEIDDKELLDEIRYPHLWDKIKKTMHEILFPVKISGAESIGK
jgi:hypothetical protein